MNNPDPSVVHIGSLSCMLPRALGVCRAPGLRTMLQHGRPCCDTVSEALYSNTNPEMGSKLPFVAPALLALT